MPKVSVIIPTYNRSNFLRAAVQSVLNQTFTDFDIVIVDDASEDDTQAVVASFSDDRIKCIRHPLNRQIAATRNTGMVNSGGEYIAFLDDDDQWLPEKLAKQVAILDGSASSVGAVYTAFDQVDVATKDVLRTIRPGKRGHILHELCIRNWIGTASTVCLRRRCLDEVGLFDESVAFGEEYDMWIRLAVPIVAGEEPTPFQRVAAASDFGNGVAAAFDRARYSCINPDLTVTLHRLPSTQWVGLDSATYPERTGFGMAESVLNDERGRIGRAVQTVLIEELPSFL